jgi:hypothetical protein
VSGLPLEKTVGFVSNHLILYILYKIYQSEGAENVTSRYDHFSGWAGEQVVPADQNQK